MVEPARSAGKLLATAAPTTSAAPIAPKT